MNVSYQVQFPLKPEYKIFCVLVLQGLLCAHDAVAQKDYFPRLPEIPLEVDEDEETIKIVQLVKSNEPLVCYFYCTPYSVFCTFENTRNFLKKILDEFSFESSAYLIC